MPNYCRLMNHGNSSYFNAIMQALFSLKDFVEYCKDNDGPVICANDLDVDYGNMKAVLQPMELDEAVVEAKKVRLVCFVIYWTRTSTYFVYIIGRSEESLRLSERTIVSTLYPLIVSRLTYISNLAAQLGVYFRCMEYVPVLDIAFLMNIVGALTAIPDVEFDVRQLLFHVFVDSAIDGNLSGL